MPLARPTYDSFGTPSAIPADRLCVGWLAHDSRADNLNPVGRAYYAFSTMLCTPTTLSEGGERPQAGAPRRPQALPGGGFPRLRRAAQTPFKLVLKARS